MMRRRARKPVVWGCLLLTVATGCVSGRPSARESAAERSRGGRATNASRLADQSSPSSADAPARTGAASFEAPLPVEVAQLDTPQGERQPDAISDASGDDNAVAGREAPRDTREILPPPLPIPPDPVAGLSYADAPGGPLVLDEVLTSVELNFPLLLAALQEQGITSGQLIAAQGAFDVNLRGREFGQIGTYDSHRLSLGVDQNTYWNGLSYFAGYRHSVGDFPIYYGDRKTGDGGEFRAGILLPLLAGRAIDKRRATVRQAAISRAIADPAIAAQRLDFLRAASRAYWSWVATGRRYQIARSVLQIAEDRDQQLAELVERGAVAEIERTDNQRIIVERQARLIAAERAWQQASLALSLYLRGADGEPVIPAAARLPVELAEPQPIDRDQLARDIERALQQRPELERLQLQRERTAVDLALARNQMLPSVNLGLEGYQDVGYGSAFSKTPLVTGTELDRTAYLASLQLDLPIQRRDARGRALAAQSAITQLRYQEQFQRDRIVVELQDAASALERSYELLQKARENLEVARRVERGERERFSRGQGTIVILNLRELVVAEASFAEVDALAEFYRSLADYRAALGVDATTAPPAVLPFPPPPAELDLPATD